MSTDHNLDEYASKKEFTIWETSMLWTGLNPEHYKHLKKEFVIPEDGHVPLICLIGHDYYKKNRSVFNALIVSVKSMEFLIIPMLHMCGDIDPFATSIPRIELAKWAQSRGDVPDFLNDNPNTTPAAKMKTVPATTINHDPDTPPHQVDKPKKDIADERSGSTRALIRLHWDDIKNKYGVNANGVEVRRYLVNKLGKDVKISKLHNFQNRLIELRNEGLLS